MTVRLRHVQLSVLTADGPYGADWPLRSGLNILSAGNTTGKSTFLQAILYALGLERMLSPRREIPLPYVMQDRVRSDLGSHTPNVVESSVAVELENSEGAVLTVRRTVKGVRDWRLVATWPGPLLSQPSLALPQRDFFVRDPGSARSESGFHRHLAEFFGWVLPEVPTFEGNSALLYMETIFPFLFVEQKTGWSAIQGPFPTFLRIQDVAKRVVEFLLKLDAQTVRLRRRALEAEIESTVASWRAQRESLVRLADAGGARISGVPTSPVPEFPTESPVLVELFRQGEWRTIDEVLRDDKQHYLRSAEIPTPTVEEVSVELGNELETIGRELEERMAVREVLTSDLRRSGAELASVRGRLDSLETDRQTNRAALKLKELGSQLGSIAESGVCPTCHQPVDRELLPPGGSPAMGIEENVRFIESQMQLYRAVASSTESSVNELRLKARATTEEINELRARLRVIQDTLISPGSLPSVAALTDRLALEQRIRELEALSEQVSNLIEDLAETAGDFKAKQVERARLPRTDFSPSDVSKLDEANTLLRQYLQQFGFTTFTPDDISLSNDNYKPYVTIRRDNLEAEAELGFQMSASDSIRMKWAYLLSFFQLARAANTNHPGFLIFDEPRQQEADRMSFNSLIRLSAERAGQDRQIIVATSETPAELATALAGLSVNLIRMEGLIIAPKSER